MAVQAISTIGFGIRYAAEAVKGTRPSTGFTNIPEVKAIPSIGTDVNALDCTPLSASFKHYVDGVKDSGGSIALTVNDAPVFKTAWNALLTAYNNAVTGEKAMWFELYYPETGMDSFYFKGKPIALGYGGADVDSVAENTANIMILDDPVWASASTTASV